MHDSHLPFAVMTVGSRRDDRRLRALSAGGEDPATDLSAAARDEAPHRKRKHRQLPVRPVMRHGKGHAEGS